MNKLALIPLAIVLTFFASCGKQQTEAEKNAEIERQVQQRLDAEHQTQAQQQLAAREADLAAREKALADQQNPVTAETPVPQTPAPRSEPVAEENSEPGSDVSTNDEASYDAFYTKLEPYGDWRETADYGFVFQPRAAEGSSEWRPYTNGRWVYTDAGWTWVSEEPFGWATYHYGRWTRLRHVGWVWVPGDEWAPAWVSWRKSDDYVGWAPLPPGAAFDRRAGIHHWADSYYDLGPEEYAFVPTNEFGSKRIEQIVVPRARNITIVSQTINVTNITYNNTTIVNQGPNYEELSRRSRQPIARLHLERGGKFEGDNPRAIVRGEVISMPAPSIAPAQRRGRPVRVKDAIGETVVDHDATEIADRPAAENARAKMRAESTPPAGLPPKKFTKPVVAATPGPPRASSPPMGTSEGTPVMNFPDDHRKEIDRQRLQKEAQRRADEERKMKQAVKPIPAPAASVPASPAVTPVKGLPPAAPAKAMHTPLPAATVVPPRQPAGEPATLPLPSVPVPKQVPAITPPIPAPPVRTKPAPPPAASIPPSATVPADKPARNVATPPLQKRAFVPPASPATRPVQVVTPPPATEPVASSSPAQRIKAPPKSQPSATASPGEDGKGPREKR